jgi:ADP-ribose pyrophosphatase YjhB (NUDIX family)
LDFMNAPTASRPQPHSFCHRCGSAYASLEWPRSCGACGNQTYQNPLPVSIAVTPVWDEKNGFLGFAGVERGLADGFGKWAFPGGFTDMGESLEAGSEREEDEETRIRARNFVLALSLVTPNGQILAFSVSDPIHASELEKAVPQKGEILAVGLLGHDQKLAFPLHEQARDALWERGRALAEAARQAATQAALGAQARRAGPR